MVPYYRPSLNMEISANFDSYALNNGCEWGWATIRISLSASYGSARMRPRMVLAYHPRSHKNSYF